MPRYAGARKDRGAYSGPGVRKGFVDGLQRAQVFLKGFSGSGRFFAAAGWGPTGAQARGAGYLQRFFKPGGSNRKGYGSVQTGCLGTKGRGPVR